MGSNHVLPRGREREREKYIEEPATMTGLGWFFHDHPWFLSLSLSLARRDGPRRVARRRST